MRPGPVRGGGGGRRGSREKRRDGRAWRHRIEYLCLRAVAALCALVPEMVADRVGAGIGWVAARVGRPRWRVVEEHLGTAFPERGEGWRRWVGRRSYAHFCREAVATFRLAGMTRAALRKRTVVLGTELLERAAREGRGVVAVSAHLGNWEVGGAAVVAHGHPMDIVVARQRNQRFDRYLTRSRERLGFGIIPRGEARRGVLRSLRAGRVIGIMGDQDARRAGIFTRFFGRPASTARGPAVLAMRSGALIITLIAIREKGWRPRYTIHLEPLSEGWRPQGPADGSREEVAAAITQAFTTRIEGWVRAHPEQYLWHHRRWKTPPPEVPAGQPASSSARPKRQPTRSLASKSCT